MGSIVCVSSETKSGTRTLVGIRIQIVRVVSKTQRGHQTICFPYYQMRRRNSKNGIKEVQRHNRFKQWILADDNGRGIRGKDSILHIGREETLQEDANGN